MNLMEYILKHSKYLKGRVQEAYVTGINVGRDLQRANKHGCGLITSVLKPRNDKVELWRQVQEIWEKKNYPYMNQSTDPTEHEV